MASDSSDPFAGIEPGTLNEPGPRKRSLPQAALDAINAKRAPVKYLRVRFDMYQKEKAARRRP